MTGAWDGGRKTVTLIEIAVIIMIAFDIYVFSAIERHEAALVELLRLHPELLTEGNQDGD